MKQNKIPVLRRCLPFLVALGLCAGWNAPLAAAEFCSDAFYIDVTLPNQARWDMCWEHRNREGIVLHKIHYTPRNGGRRMILNEAAIAQIHVPYDDNGARYHDVTDYGLGGGYMAQLAQNECPGGQLLTFNRKPVLCQQTEANDTAYRYGTDQLAGNALSLFSVSKIGAYHYIPVWRFLDNGAIEPGIGATGALQRFGDSSKARYGWLTGDNKISLAHLHNFFWKLDFDLAGTRSDDYVEELNFTQENGQTKRTNRRYSSETASRVAPRTLRRWRIADGNIKATNGQPIAYEIRLHQAEHQDIGPDSEPFTHNDLYVTHYRNCERFASHNPTNTGCAENLADFVNGESLSGQDIVVWPSTTFYHMPRAEDAPIMDAHWSFISLTPLDWHDQNPLSDAQASSGNTSTPAATPTPAATATPATAPTATPTAAPTPTPTATTTPAPTPTATAAPTPAPTATPSSAGVIHQANFESNTQDWTLNPEQNDTASHGQWEFANPQATSHDGYTLQIGNAYRGSRALVTGAAAGGSAHAHDVDGGVTRMRSPQFDLPAGHQYRIKLAWYFAHLSNATAADYLKISLVNTSGSRSTLLLVQGSTVNRAAQWRILDADISALAGSKVQLLIEAADGGNNSIVEAAIDEIQIEQTGRSATPPPISGGIGAPGDVLFRTDFSTAAQWTLNPLGDDSATKGQWQNAIPKITHFQGRTLQPGPVQHGGKAMVTGAAEGEAVGSNDVDGGKTSIRSPLIRLPANRRYQLSLDYYFAHLRHSSSVDYFNIYVVRQNGQRQQLFSHKGRAANQLGNWQELRLDLSGFAGQAIYLDLEAADGGAGGLIEAAFDNLRITYQ